MQLLTIQKNDAYAIINLFGRNSDRSQISYFDLNSLTKIKKHKQVNFFF